MEIFIKVILTDQTIADLKKQLEELTGKDIPPFPYKDGDVITVDVEKQLQGMDIDISDLKKYKPALDFLMNFGKNSQTDDVVDFAENALSGFMIRSKKPFANKKRKYLKYNNETGYFFSDDEMGAAVFKEIKAIQMVSNIKGELDFEIEHIPVEDMLQGK